MTAMTVAVTTVTTAVGMTVTTVAVTTVTATVSVRARVKKDGTQVSKGDLLNQRLFFEQTNKYGQALARQRQSKKIKNTEPSTWTSFPSSSAMMVARRVVGALLLLLAGLAYGDHIAVDVQTGTSSSELTYLSTSGYGLEHGALLVLNLTSSVCQSLLSSVSHFSSNRSYPNRTQMRS